MHSGESNDRDRRENVTARAPRGVRERAEPAFGRPERQRGPRSTVRDDQAEPTATDRRARQEDQRPERTGPSPRRCLTAEDAARLAADHVAEMTGKEPEGITSLERSDQGVWQIDVEVVESRRIPDSTDILAIYRAELDPGGELLAYRRIERYSRCQVGER
jgi:hypothetical protein